jgi:hypothetical protein
MFSPSSSGFFPLGQRRAMWARIEPRRYGRQVDPLILIQTCMKAFLLRVPSLEAMVGRWGDQLKTHCQSTLSYALRRPTFLGLAQALLSRLEARFAPKRGQLVVVDSMPLTLPATRQHGCRSINAATVGGGVLWAYCPQAPAGSCPVKILRLISGPWHDTQAIADVELTPHGPIYLLDRGFWSIALVARWLSQGVHFILRVNKQDFTYTPLKTCGSPRVLPGGLRVAFDGLATLGGPRRRSKPAVRLVIAWLPDGTDLILVSDRRDWSAQALLDAYRQRGQTEAFHRLLKTTIGLAHLYSFQERGIFFLLHVAVILAVLLFLTRHPTATTTLQTLQATLAALRQAMGLLKHWRRNMLPHYRNSKPEKPYATKPPWPKPLKDTG